MRTLWKGAISFGLVTIPVSLYPATRKEELKFRMLRKSDLSPINYKRVAQADGKKVPWEEIVKGYEHEKGKYVILKEEDFARVDVEATRGAGRPALPSHPGMMPVVPARRQPRGPPDRKRLEFRRS